MHAATDRSARALVALLPLALVACGGTGGGPRTAPPPVPSAGAGWAPEMGPDPMDLQRALDGAAATSLRIVGRIVGSGVTVPVDLLLTRSGAMRLQAIDDSERMVISNGSRLWVHGARGVFEADAWDTSIEGADDLLGALTAFDLVEALLPAPWPLLEQERTTTSMARTPEGLWVSTLAMSPAGRQVVRRRALIDPVDGRVLRRQRYDAAGNLELDVEGVAGPGASVSIGRPQEGAELTLQIDTLVHDPDLDIVSFTRS